GGAGRANVFTRLMLALHGFIPWRAVPVMPVEIMLLPNWFPFHLDKISYWSRTVIVPLLVLMHKKPVARNPKGVRIDELFLQPPHTLGPAPKAPQQKASWFWFFRGVDNGLRVAEPYFPKRPRQRAIDRAIAWVIERLNGEDGLGAIFTAMANSVMMFDVLGYPEHHPQRAIARKSVEKLLAVHEHEAYCQPCVSPVWDTALAAHALIEAGGAEAEIRLALGWLCDRQLLDEPADWQIYRPKLAGGGWAFQYRNDPYPDLDDTSAVAWAMHRADEGEGPGRYGERIERAANWLAGMQSRGGGFGAFDADNTSFYLNEIPFADHGALLDPPTEDVTGRCVALFSLLGEQYRKPLRHALAYLGRKQHKSGAWWGRWGTNYIYGTWSVLAAFELAGIAANDKRVRRAVAWLKSVQHADGGFGESNDTYERGGPPPGTGEATPEQTAWALLALMAGGEAGSEAVRRGIAWLLREQGKDGLWHTDRFNAPGFPRVFYLRYHGYSAYFPLWALARYRNLTGH
ncbi:MAG: squalene--hopene cyclase, partial [Gammaproteobacteria bacterium]